MSGTNGTNSQQWTFHKAFVEEGFDLSYEDEQSVIEVPFRVVPDPDNLTATDALFKYETFVTQEIRLFKESCELLAAVESKRNLIYRTLLNRGFFCLSTLRFGHMLTIQRVRQSWKWLIMWI